MGILEENILEYEKRENTDFMLLLQANVKAEKIIHDMFQ